MTEAHGATARTGDRRAAGRRGDQRGSGISLWVIVMTPILLFAGVVARAGPQRMAAESTMQDSAEDLAAMAAIRRHTEGIHEGPLVAFPFDCQSPDAQLRASCDRMEAMLVQDLADVGIDVASLRGFYSDSLSQARPRDGSASAYLPCRAGSGAGTDTERLFVDGAHAAVAGDWAYGWAAAQVWPGGVRVAADSTSYLTGIAQSTAAPCDEHPGDDSRGDLLDPSNPRAREITRDVGSRTLINAR